MHGRGAVQCKFHFFAPKEVILTRRRLIIKNRGAISACNGKSFNIV
jgi:hypothetical protein